MATGPVEKYQLKWNSHLNNLNASVATLFRNEKFADVILMTSNANEACGIIRAHRVILSTCSHYFSTLFEACPGQPMICVVLPPEVTKKVLDILVQYMYCGEATVHNDVLNEVLKGGELLKIRGLWRQDSSDYLDHHVYPGHYPASHHPPPSHHHSTVRDRPMIIRNPDERPRTPPPPRDPPMIVSASSSYYPSTSVYVKKDLDAEAASCATCRVTLHSNEAPPLPLPPIPGTSTATDAPLRPPLAENHNFINSTFRRSSTTTMTTTGKCANAKSSSSSATSTFYPTKPNTEERRDFPRQIIHMNKSMQNENPFAESHLPPLPPPPPDEVLRRDSVTSGGSMPPIKIKQEPRDWPEEFDQKPQVDGVTTVVKQELVYNEETEGGSNSGNEDLPMYTPLTCELCKETFTVPGDWVRHIENHAETPQTVPKKRRRTEEMINNENMKCDLCSTYYLTPAAWVRHIQSTHTENELALSNLNTLAKASSYRNGGGGNVDDQNCVACTVSNYASPSGQQQGAGDCW